MSVHENRTDSETGALSPILFVKFLLDQSFDADFLITNALAMHPNEIHSELGGKYISAFRRELVNHLKSMAEDIDIYRISANEFAIVGPLILPEQWTFTFKSVDVKMKSRRIFLQSETEGQ